MRMGFYPVSRFVSFLSYLVKIKVYKLTKLTNISLWRLFEWKKGSNRKHYMCSQNLCLASSSSISSIAHQCGWANQETDYRCFLFEFLNPWRALTLLGGKNSERKTTVISFLVCPSTLLCNRQRKIYFDANILNKDRPKLGYHIRIC